MNITEDTHGFFPNYSGYLSDPRLERRCQQLWKKLNDRPSSSIRKIASNNAEQKAYHLEETYFAFRILVRLILGSIKAG